MPYTAGLAADLSADRYGAVLGCYRHTRRFVRPIKETGKRPRPDRMGLGLFFCKVCRKIMPPGGARVLKLAHHDAAVVFGGVALSVTFGDTARVAAPSVCFAAARILLAAAPTAPPCFRHWRRSSPLLPEGEPLAGRVTSYCLLKAQDNAKNSALLQRAAASGQYPLSSCC